jgi:uncharacterized integral membrane protein
MEPAHGSARELETRREIDLAQGYARVTHHHDRSTVVTRRLPAKSDKGNGMSSEPEHPANEGWRPTTKQIIAAVIAVVALLFIFQNTGTGHFHFLWFDFQAPVWIWLSPSLREASRPVF